MHSKVRTACWVCGCVGLVSLLTLWAPFYGNGLSAANSRSATPSKERTQVARLAVANELLRLHWASWVSGKEMKAVSQEAAAEINRHLEVGLDVEFLLPEVQSSPRRKTAFEKHAVEEIRSGVAEVWSEDGEQFVRGIRASQSCLNCHHPIGAPGMSLELGDLLGVAKVQLQSDS